MSSRCVEDDLNEIHGNGGVCMRLNSGGVIISLAWLGARNSVLFERNFWICKASELQSSRDDRNAMNEKQAWSNANQGQSSSYLVAATTWGAARTRMDGIHAYNWREMRILLDISLSNNNDENKAIPSLLCQSYAYTERPSTATVHHAINIHAHTALPLQLLVSAMIS